MQCTSSVASASSRSANTPVAAKEPKHRMSNETSYNQRAGRNEVMQSMVRACPLEACTKEGFSRASVDAHSEQIRAYRRNARSSRIYAL
eukprot:285892-Pelagomonas_calceolata.AAC.2